MSNLTPDERAKEFIDTAIAKFGDRDPGLVGSFLAIAELIREAKSEGAQLARTAILEKLNNAPNLFRNRAMKRVANHLINGKQPEESKQ